MLLAAGNAIMQDLGTLTLAFVSQTQEVVLFNIALPIAMIVQSMLVVLNVFNPMIAEYCAKNEKALVGKLFNRLFMLTAAMMLAAVPVLYFGGELVITLLLSGKVIAAKWCTIFLVEASLLAVPVRALLNLFNTTDRKSVSLKALAPLGVSAAVLFPCLSYLYGATGAGLAAFLSTAAWLAAYVFYYVRFIRDEQNMHT